MSNTLDLQMLLQQGEKEGYVFSWIVFCYSRDQHFTTFQLDIEDYITWLRARYVMFAPKDDTFDLVASANFRTWLLNTIPREKETLNAC